MSFGTPRELREDEILDIIQRFAEAARFVSKRALKGSTTWCAWLFDQPVFIATDQ